MILNYNQMKTAINERIQENEHLYNIAENKGADTRQFYQGGAGPEANDLIFMFNSEYLNREGLTALLEALEEDQDELIKTLYTATTQEARNNEKGITTIKQHNQRP